MAKKKKKVVQGIRLSKLIERLKKAQKAFKKGTDPRVDLLSNDDEGWPNFDKDGDFYPVSDVDVIPTGESNNGAFCVILIGGQKAVELE